MLFNQFLKNKKKKVSGPLLIFEVLFIIWIFPFYLRDLQKVFKSYFKIIKYHLGNELSYEC